MFLDTFSILKDLFYQILTFFENVGFGPDVEKCLFLWKKQVLSGNISLFLQG